MVQADMNLYKKPQDDDQAAHKQYSDMICLTKAPEFNNPTRYFRSTYDFSSLRRYKTVVELEPTLAPIRYYRAINYGIPQELRHKSTVDCDFRPRPRSFRETTWIFPKHGRDIYTSTLEHNQLVDTKWYMSKVCMAGSDEVEHDENTNTSVVHEGTEKQETTPLEVGDFSGQNGNSNYEYNNNNHNISDKLRYEADCSSTREDGPIEQH